eukprot:scaffold36889_cov64-Attheya_sp.AAC.4
MHGVLSVYRHRCNCAAATFLLLLSRAGFVDISLVEAPAIKMGGCGACGKGRNGGKWDKTKWTKLSFGAI